MKEKGMLIVLSGPSGAGKGTLCDLLLKKIKNLYLSISVTTRQPRNNEKNGVDYLFTSEEDFISKIKNDEFIEWAKVHNNYYGTPKKYVDKLLKEGKDVILEIDTQGAAQIKKKYPEGIFIFIMPPGIKELKKRIIKRGSETEESLNIRIQNARKELRESQKYDYVIVNDDLQEAVSNLSAIIIAERCKVSRNRKLLQKYIDCKE